MAALRRNTQALHDDVAANRPRPVNRLDPGFAPRNDQGLALALPRARPMLSYPGYLYALRRYVATFDDGHLGYWATDGSPDLPARWPGFLTGFGDGGRQIVRPRLPDAPYRSAQSCSAVTAAARRRSRATMSGGSGDAGTWRHSGSCTAGGC